MGFSSEKPRPQTRVYSWKINTQNSLCVSPMFGSLAQPFQVGRRPAKAMSGRNASSRRKAGLATDLSVETRTGRSVG